MKIYINQMGYRPDNIKTAVLAQEGASDAPLPQSLNLIKLTHGRESLFFHLRIKYKAGKITENQSCCGTDGTCFQAT